MNGDDVTVGHSITLEPSAFTA